MSLTSVLKEKNRTHLKSWFKHHFPNPGSPSQKEAVVISNSSSARAGEIGTAFDYLFRFNLERINGAKYQGRQWVAETGLKRLLSLFDISEVNTSSVAYGAVESSRERFKRVLTDGFANAQQNQKRFIDDGQINADLIKSCVFLARLDVFVRATVIVADYEHVEDEEIAEIEALFSATPWDEFKANERCLLNPVFGAGSKLVGGADGDLIIGNTLIDVKSTKNLKLDRDDINQLIGYYLLSLIGKSHEGIEKLGVYFARFGLLWTIPLTHFYDMEKYPVLAEQFKRLVTDRELDLVKDDTMRKYQNLKNIDWDFLKD